MREGAEDDVVGGAGRRVLGDRMTSSSHWLTLPAPSPMLVTVHETVTVAGSAMVWSGACTLLTARSGNSGSVRWIGPVAATDHGAGPFGED